MANVVSPGGVDYRFQPPKWCRHKPQFVTYASAGVSVTATCSNCNATAYGNGNPAAYDALMAVEKVAIVTEVVAS